MKVDDWQTGLQLAKIEQAVRDCRQLLEQQVAELTVGPQLLPVVRGKLEKWFLLPAAESTHPAYRTRVRHVRNVFDRVLKGLTSYVPVEVEPDEYYYTDEKGEKAIAYLVGTPWSDIHLPRWWFDRNARARARYFLHECLHKFAYRDDIAYLTTKGTSRSSVSCSPSGSRMRTTS